MSENPFAQFVKPQEKKEENPFSQFVQKEPQKQEGNDSQGNFSRGFETAMRQVPQTIGGVIGLAGDAVGNDAVKDYGMNIYNNQSKKIQDISKDSDSFTNVLNGDASLGDWATYGTGYVGGQALQAIATGGVGAFVGKKVAQAGLNKALKEGVEQQISEEAKKRALSKAANRGATVGMFGSNAVQEVGSIYPEALEQAEKDGRTLDGMDLARVTGSGLAAAGIDTLTDMSMLKGVLGGGSSASNIFKRAAKTIPTGMVKEGVTEGVQTGIERWGAQKELGDNEAIRDYVDSAALGALGGGFAGAGGAIQQAGKREHQQEQARILQEQQRITDENQAKEQQQIAEQQQKIFGFGKDQPNANYDADDIYAKTGIPPSPIIDESKFPPDTLNYENGIDYTQPKINITQDQAGTTQQNNENGVNYAPPEIATQLSLVDEQPQQVDNGIDFERPEQGPTDLERQIQFNDLYGQSAPDPQIDYSAVSPFTDTQKPIINQKKLSEQLGINPEDGPLSSAAALAVDGGAFSKMTEMAQASQDGTFINEGTNATASNSVNPAVPSSYQQLLGSNNYERQSTNESNQNEAIQQGLAQTDNAGESISQQHDINTADEMAGEFEKNGTESAPQTKTTQPILGQDGKNKWFGNQEEAQAFIDKKKLGNDYQVVQDGKRFEIQPNVAQVQDGNQSQLKALEQQFEEAKTVPEKARIRKEINALQQGDNQPSAIENTISASENNISMPKNTILDAQNNIDKTQTNNVADQLAQLEQQFLDAKSVPQKAKLKKQIDQLKSQQPEITTAPFGSEQIQKQYGDTAESVMSDIEILGDDFTIDLRDKNKKTNALNNPNYNAVQKADGSVEIVGMKHPSTGEWVGKKPNAISVDENAHQAATSSQNNTPEPTQAQIEAGNYKKGHIKVHGLDISIENPKGSERRGTDPNGKEWAHTMSDHYGYIKRTKGADNEHIDTYIGNNPDSNQVFIVDQVDQKSGNFDEHKVMLGFDSQEEAATAYKSNFDKGWKVGPIRNMDMEQFKDWLKNEDTSKPAIQKNVKDSIENIRSEKIRQKDLADMHNSVYGLATDEQLQESLKHLNKEIKKAQKQSENEVVNGKRSTRKAVASGALDRFLKNRVDLETYIKARQNGEVKQRNKKIDDYSRDKLKPDNERRGTSPLDTTFNALSVVSATRRVLSVLQHLKLSATQDSSISGRITVGSAGIKGGFDVQVISSFDGLPTEIQKDATYQDDKGNTQNYDVSAVWHKGTLYVVADQVYGDNEKQLTTFDAYEEMLAHEIIGHFGVQQIFGQEYKTKLQQLYNALGELEGIRKIASKNGVDMAQFESAYIEPYTQGAKEGIYAESDVQQALVGELFAFVAQNAKSRPFVRQKLKEVIGYIRQWLRDRGFDKFLSRYNDADLMMFLSEARKAVVDRSYFGKYKNQEFSSKNNSDTPLYSRRTKSNSGSTTQQVRDVLIDRFGKETIDELERQGKLEIIQDYQVEGVEGFYYNGKAVLVASNLTAESTVPTFLHELGGHAGFQNMMNQKQYNELMNQFNKLVEQGNPVAMAAKVLAEREQGSERQQLEYLPYLLTLSSTMQQRNVIQRNALQKLINNIVSYVKATLFDNFGINLNLNPNDIVALAERMIEKSSYNAENATSPLYSRQFFDNTINNLSGSIKHLSAKSIKDKTGYKFTDWLGIGLSALGRRQLTEIYSKILPQLNKYNELAAQMDADKNDAGAEADSIVREWANLNDEDQLAELMHDSTLAKIDPAKPYQQGDNKVKYQQLLHAYNNLSPEAQAMYLKARDAYKKHYAKVHQAIKERILRSELSSQKKADLLKQMDDNFFGYVKGVYFPLARFGKYVVVMRNQNGEVESVSRAETMGEAQSLRSELMQKYPHYKTDRVVLDKEFNASRDAVGRGFMTNLFAEVDNLGLSTAEQAEFEDTLSQLYLSSMPDLSWAKHGIHRKGTAGFSQDARRAFAQNMFHGAGYLAKLRYGDQLAQQLDDMQKYASEQSKLNDSYDQPTAQRVIDEMNKRHDNLMNPKSHPLSSALTSLGFIYYLGLSPAAAMVNLLQTALVAYPIMGAKWGFDKAANELRKASNDFRKGVEFHKVKWEGSKTDLYKTISSDISKFLNKDEKQAYEDAVARGVIDVTQAHDLAGIAQGEDSGIMWKTRPIMRAASVMFHSAERFNREVTFIAAYRLARQSGEKHDSAFDQAVDATYRGHFDYSSGNRPRIMQGNVAKVLLLFKQFGQNMVYTLTRQTYQSIKGETKAERKEARKSLAAILAMHATFAGALGLPMVGMLLSVASWWEGDDDEPWDAEVALRNYLAEAFNPTISNMLMKGAPRGIGVDISGRVGINNLLLPDVQEGLEGKKWWDSASAAVLGPIGGIGANIAKGAQEISEGHNLRGVESMLPVFLKNFAKTYRYADEGVQDKTGVSIMDEVSSMDLLVQGMGFSPADIRTANEGKSAIYQLNRKLNERRSRLMALWSRAKMMDDQQEMDEIWEQIQGFNDKNPSRRITRMNLNQSYRNRQRRIDRAEDGIYLSRNRQDAREAGYFAFGE